MLLKGVIKILYPTNKNILLKMLKIKSGEKSLPINSQHIVSKVSIIWAKLDTYSRMSDLLSSSNLCYWEELLEFSNLWLKSYQYYHAITNTL